MATRPAVLADVDAIRRIGAAAGRRFASVDDPRIAERADDDPFDAEDLRRWIDAGRAWVSGDDPPAGFVVVDVVDRCAHIEEVSVAPEHEGRGHGGALLDAATTWARAEGMHAVTLTTFADVEWNRPYYERRGFRVLGRDEIGPELAERIATEDRDGLDRAIRVCMSRSV
ncbi:MAG: GNAT family N-acetyltransferase [Acidimicrobiales bacterium]|nr:GNAT family N-acetyltransferase [Acidimicrobiales bacterium]